MLLVTGFPRSGTAYLSGLLKNAGLAVGHETVENDGTVSWLHAIPGGTVDWHPSPVEPVAFDKIIHLLRDPIRAISSAESLSDGAFKYMFRALDNHPGGPRGLKWYMWSWLHWNEAIEKLTDCRIQIDDMNDETLRREFLEIIGADPKAGVPNKWTNSRPHAFFSWADLEKEDAGLCARIKEKALEYGYPIQERVTLGACIMGRNEEEMLPRCLESIKGVVDEIVFVDTGSTDKTVEIAESYGCKVIIPENLDDYFVETSTGRNLNFGKTRNETLRHCTTDWLLILDCDEELIGAFSNLKKFLYQAQDRHTSVSVVAHDMQKGESTMQFTFPRMFRRGHISYESIVHNQPIMDGDSVLIQDVEVKHYGYDLPPEKMKLKHERTLGLLQKRLEDNPNDYPVYFYLAQSHGCMGDAEKSLENGMKYIRLKSVMAGFNDAIYYSMLQIYKRIHGYDPEFAGLLHEALTALPEDIDLTMVTMQYAEETKDSDMLRSSAEKFIRLFEDYQKNPHKHGSRFIYNAAKPQLAYAMFHVATQNLRRGVDALGRFDKLVDLLPEETRDSATKDMQTACEALNISWKRLK